jgi:hypothetical protein
MTTGLRPVRRALMLAAILTFAAVPAAHAIYVKGHQLPVGNSGVKYELTGGMVGKWRITHFHIKHERNQLLKIKGQERFTGCVDLARDASCVGDPTGKLFFRFRYWVQLSEDGDSQLVGTCSHRIVDSADGLAGTTGFLMMVDTPAQGTRFGVKTLYEGEIDPPGFVRHTAADPPDC